MIGNMPRLSVICPAYDEEEVLPHFHRALTSALATLATEFSVEIVYVDDGSRDRTLAVIQSLAAHDPRVRYLSFTRNFGHQAALTAGLEHARGDVVITLDSDLQHPPALIPELLRRWREGYDVVLTVRADDVRTGFLKRAFSRWFYRLMGWLSDTEVRLAAADFRLLSRRALAALLQMRETHRFLRGMVQWLGFPTAEVPYAPAPRAAGASKYTARRMIDFALDAVFSFSRFPGRLVLGAGALTFGAGLLLAGVFTGFALAGRLPLDAGSAFVLVALHTIGGGVLVGLGLVGEYVGRVYEEIKGRPLYVLKESSDDAARWDREAAPHRRNVA